MNKSIEPKPIKLVDLMPLHFHYSGKDLKEPTGLLTPMRLRHEIDGNLYLLFYPGEDAKFTHLSISSNIKLTTKQDFNPEGALVFPLFVSQNVTGDREANFNDRKMDKFMEFIQICYFFPEGPGSMIPDMYITANDVFDYILAVLDDISVHNKFNSPMELNDLLIPPPTWDNLDDYIARGKRIRKALL